MKNLEKRVCDLESDVDGLVELLATTPSFRELFIVVPGHLQAARQVEGDANAALARLGLDAKNLVGFKGDIDASILGQSYAQGSMGKNAEARKVAEKAVLAESPASQAMASWVGDWSYRLLHAEDLAVRAKNARRVVDDVSDAAYRLLRLVEAEVKCEC